MSDETDKRIEPVGSPEEAMGPVAGRIVVAPEVLATIVRQAALQVPGVARLATVRFGPWALSPGLRLRVAEGRAQVDLALVVRPERSFREIARQTQEEVARAVHELTGLEVTAVNVLIADVEVEERGASEIPGAVR